MDIINAFDNIFGGHDFNADGHHYSTRDNILGGEDIYEDGKMVASTHDNIFGGEDYYDVKEGLVITTKSNIHGGHDVYSTDHGYEGSIHEDIAGVSYMSNDGSHSYIIQEMGNAATILGYSDPLAHVGSYIMPTLIL